MLAVVGRGVTLEILSAMWEAEQTHCRRSGQQEWLSQTFGVGWPRWFEENLSGPLEPGSRRPGRPFPHWEVLSHALIAWCGQPAHQHCVKPYERLLLRWGSDNVFHLGRLLLVELWHHIIILGMLTCDVCQLELRISQCETNSRSIGPEGRQPHSDSTPLSSQPRLLCPSCCKV